MFGNCPVNALLAGGQLPEFLDEDFVHSVCGTPSTCARSYWLGTPRTLSGEGALNVSITLAAKRLLEVTFVCNFCTQLCFIIRVDCSQFFCVAYSFDKLILASLHAIVKEV